MTEESSALAGTHSAQSQLGAQDVMNPTTFVAPDVIKDFTPRVTIEFCDRVSPPSIASVTRKFISTPSNLVSLVRIPAPTIQDLLFLTYIV